GQVKSVEAEKPMTGIRVGVPGEYFGEGVMPQVEELVRAAIMEFKNMGATIEDVSMPNIVHALAAYYIIAPAEVSSNMARYDGIRYGHSIERTSSKDDVHDLTTIYSKSRAQGLG